MRIPAATGVELMVFDRGAHARSSTPKPGTRLLDAAVVSSASPVVSTASPVVDRPRFARVNSRYMCCIWCCLCLAITVPMAFVLQQHLTTPIDNGPFPEVRHFEGIKGNQTLTESIGEAGSLALDAVILLSIAVSMITYAINRYRQESYNASNPDDQPESRVASIFDTRPENMRQTRRLQIRATANTTAVLTIATLWSLTAMYKPSNFYEVVRLLPTTTVIALIGQCALSIPLCLMRSFCTDSGSLANTLLYTVTRAMNPCCCCDEPNDYRPAFASRV